MHFPTSLPPTSGSPAAKLSLERGSSPHPETFDGPLPPLPRPEFTWKKLPLHPRPTAPRVLRLAGPRFLPEHLPPIPPRPVSRGVHRYNMSKPPLPSPSATSGAIPPSLTIAKMKMKGGLPTERLLEARNSWKRKRKARLDGARKPDPIGTIQNPEYGGDSHMFRNTREDTERGSSFVSVNPKHKLKKIFGIGLEETEKPIFEHTQRTLPTTRRLPTIDQHERSLSSDTINTRNLPGRVHSRITLAGPKEKLMAARASREEDKDDFEEDPDWDESDDRILGSERRRMSSQMKKLSINEIQDRYEAHRERKRSEKEAELMRAQNPPGGAHGGSHGFTEVAKRKIIMAKEELQAYRSTRREERRDAGEGPGARIVNAVRAAKARFEDRDAEREAKRQAGMRLDPSSRRSEQPSERPQFLSTPRRVPVFSSPSYNKSSSSSSLSLAQPNPPYFEADNPQSPKDLGGPHLYKAPSPPTERNRAYQQVFPARPSPSYRPTLSPVYSKSPIPTNSLSQLASASPNLPKVSLSDTTSTSTGTQSGVVPTPTSVDPPQPTFSPPYRGIEARHQDIPIKSPPSSTSTITRERVLRSANEISNIKKSLSYGHPRKSLITEADIPPLKLPSPEVKPASTKKTPQNLYSSKGPSPKSRVASLPGGLSVDPKQPVRSEGTHETTYPNIDLSKTPTPSALEFWAIADASLAPSESASAQPANRRGEPPPDIWKDADRALNLRKGGPTMEEWIASLPGLGLRLGPWATDGKLDSKMLEELRTTNPKSSSIHGDEILRAELVEKLKEMDDRALDQVDEFVPEDEVGLTPEEVKALGLQGYELLLDNTPPTVIDPSLLHPDYIPSSSASMISTSIPKNNQLPTVQKSNEEKILPLMRARTYDLSRAPAEQCGLVDFRPPKRPNRPPNLAGDVTSRLDTLEKYWDRQGIVVGTVLRRMLWIVDTMIVKEREDAQRLVRKKEMGWMDSEDGYESEDDDDKEQECE